MQTVEVQTFFQKKEIYKGTWRSPDGRTTNQINHMVIQDSYTWCSESI